MPVAVLDLYFSAGSPSLAGGVVVCSVERLRPDRRPASTVKAQSTLSRARAKRKGRLFSLFTYASHDIVSARRLALLENLPDWLIGTAWATEEAKW
jgi:hypothetical protein